MGSKYKVFNGRLGMFGMGEDKSLYLLPNLICYIQSDFLIHG